MEHDFRKLYWGHNHYMKQLNGDIYEGATWTTPRVREGDTLVWETAYGEVVLEAVKVKAYNDPPDMAHVTAKVVERRVRRKFLEDPHTPNPPWDYKIID